MINGFFKIIQDDIAFMNQINKKTSLRNDEKVKVSFVSMRFIATIGMVGASILGLHALSSPSLVGKAFKLLSAACIYTVSHDVFVISKNYDDGLPNQLGKIFGTAWNHGKDVYSGKKTMNDTPLHPFTVGTFYRPLWSDVLYDLDKG